MTPPVTPSQTIGPFLHIGLPWPDGPDVVPDGTPGAFVISGVVLDGAGEPVTDAMVETWQADPRGGFDHPDDPRAPTGPTVAGFRGFGRCPTDGTGRFWVRTVKPGPVPAPDGTAQAPHLDVSVFARGLLHRLVTRIYFDDEVEANAADPVLTSVDPAFRSTLVAARTAEGYRFDIRLRGDGETVFFAL
ncbi:MAG TPA: protocatechuate 3,4-dioxygenase subunit alpha [Mycobacteriales bacterium]